MLLNVVALKYMKKCLICDEEIKEFMSFGRMPLANGFLPREKFDSEYFFDMQVSLCPIVFEDIQGCY